MLRVSTLVPVIFGLVAGIIAVIAGKRMIDEERQKASAQIKSIPLVVAKSDIPYAAEITADMLEMKEVQKSIFTGAHAKSDEIVGRVTSNRIVAGVPLLDSMLAPAGTPPGAEYQIPEGVLPVSVEVDTAEVAHLRPGQHVNVNYIPPKMGGMRSGLRESRLIFQHVEVFAVGDRRIGDERSDDEGSSKKGARAGLMAKKETPVMLLVPKDDAGKMTTAIHNGEISLTLLPMGDNSKYTVLPLEDEKPEVVVQTPVERTQTVEPPSQLPPPPVEKERVVIVNGKAVKLQEGGLQPVDPSSRARGSRQSRLNKKPENELTEAQRKALEDQRKAVEENPKPLGE